VGPGQLPAPGTPLDTAPGAPCDKALYGPWPQAAAPEQMDVP